MNSELDIFEILRVIVLCPNPIIFIYGFLLILYSNYKKVEELLTTEIIKVKITLIIDMKKNEFHDWLLEKRTLAGTLYVAYSIITTFLLFKKF